MFFALITTVLRFVLLQFILLAMSNMRARNYDKTKLTTERGFYCLRRLRCVDTNGLIRIVYYWLLNGDHFMSNDKSIGCWSWWGRNFFTPKSAQSRGTNEEPIFSYSPFSVYLWQTKWAARYLKLIESSQMCRITQFYFLHSFTVSVYSFRMSRLMEWQ